MMGRIAPALAAATLTILPATAIAGSAFNVPVAARIVSFVLPPPSGAIPTVIIYEPGNAVSESDATAVEHAIGGGLALGRGTIQVRRVPVEALSRLSGAQVAFVTAGLRDVHPQIAAASARLSLLTISFDPHCVQAGRCVVGITSSPRVQITVSKSAAKASKVRFSSAFLMLVAEVD